MPMPYVGPPRNLGTPGITRGPAPLPSVGTYAFLRGPLSTNFTFPNLFWVRGGPGVQGTQTTIELSVTFMSQYFSPPPPQLVQLGRRRGGRVMLPHRTFPTYTSVYEGIREWY